MLMTGKPLHVCFLALLIVAASSACRERRNLKSTMADLDAGGSGAEHPCSIAANQTSFSADSYSRVDDAEKILSRREWSVIRSNAMLSRLAYETPTFIDRTARAWGYKTIDVTVNGPMQAFVASNDKCVVLSFRGTDMWSLKDWFVDASAARRAVHGGMMHSGFLRAFQSMAGRLAVHLDAQGAHSKTLWVTGHSLGGALAGVFAYSNKFTPERTSFEIDRIITYGQPLFTDGPLAAVMRREFLGRYVRVVNDKDIVARIPNWFEHFGSLVWIKHEGSEFYRDEIASTGLPGSDQEPSILPAAIPEELSASPEAFESFMNGNHVSPTDRDGHVIYGGLKITDDHSMDLYLDRVSQKWRLSN